MIAHHQEPISDEEIKLLKQATPFISQLFGKKRSYEQAFVDVYEVAVLAVYISPDFVSEYAVYILDLGDVLMVLSGEWMFDPHTAHVPDRLFDEWDGETKFFGKFTIRCDSESRTVFRFQTRDNTFVSVQRLASPLAFLKMSECLVIDRGDDIIGSLKAGGLVRE